VRTEASKAIIRRIQKIKPTRLSLTSFSEFSKYRKPWRNEEATNRILLSSVSLIFTRLIANLISTEVSQVYQIINLK